jgi:hypothetical protein
LCAGRTLHVWDHHGRHLNAGALRPIPESPESPEAPHVDPSQRLHGNGDRLTEFGLDCCLQTLLADAEHTRANAARDDQADPSSDATDLDADAA